MQRGLGVEVLAQQDGERADHVGRPAEPLGDPLDLLQDVAGAVGVGVVVGVTGVQDRVEQLFLRLEVMQQARRADPGLLGDLPERGTPPAVPRQQSLGHGQDPLLAVLSLSEQRGVRPLIRHPVPPANLLNVH